MHFIAKFTRDSSTGKLLLILGVAYLVRVFVVVVVFLSFAGATQCRLSPLHVRVIGKLSKWKRREVKLRETSVFLSLDMSANKARDGNHIEELFT